MAGQIQISVSARGIESTIQALRRLSSREARTANGRALRDTAALARTQIRRELGDRKGVARKRSINRLVKSFGNVRGQSAKVWIGLRAGLGLKEAPDAVRSKAPRGFQATVGSGHTGWFERSPRAATSTGRDSRGNTRRGRLPINEVKINLMPEAKSVIEKWTRHMFRTRYPGIYRSKFRELTRG